MTALLFYYFMFLIPALIIPLMLYKLFHTFIAWIFNLVKEIMRT